MKLKYFFLFFCVIFTIPLFASHIIGGEFTYKCLGNGDYEFELYIYQECSGLDPVPFDRTARIAIYECGGNIDCASLMQQEIDPITNFVNNFTADLLEEQAVAPNEVECLVPDRIPCVTRGTYKFKLSDKGINLPNSNNSYYLVYQRCCRNEGILNINEPKQQGSSYFVEITPIAQTLCNNSPVFDTFPDLIICQNFDIDYFHSATDEDGDSLVYYFSNPIAGGGTADNSPNNLSCAGVQPTPACPPPFGVIPYSSSYTTDNPLGQSIQNGQETSVSMDKSSGLIFGVPSLTGLFVLSAVVEEYRDGQLIGSVRREFQHQVARCDRSVQAIIKSDERIGDNAFRTTVCEEGSILFEHESQPAQFINAVRWEFDLLNGNLANSTNDNIQVDFPNFGDYMGTLYVNENSKNCADSATIFVSIFPETIADFAFDYDTCQANMPVSFTNLSTTQSAGIESFNWDFGDTNTSNNVAPNHLYSSAGNFSVQLTAIDENNCSATAIKELNYFPLSPESFTAPSGIVECAPATTTFDNLREVLTDDYDIEWNFGDGTTSSEVAPNYTYENPGTYTVSLSIQSPAGCSTNSLYGDLVQILPAPTAQFTYTPEEIKVANPTANFIDQSSNAISWNWDFNGVGSSNEQNPVFTFPDTGMQVIQLIVTHNSGCTDTSSAIIDIFPSIELFVPNAFTPNGDGQNDSFQPKGFLFGPLNYEFSIWNRWGDQVFSTTTFGEGWNGKKNNTGIIAPLGVYLYLIKFVDSRGKEHTLKGYATLVR